MNSAYQKHPFTIALGVIAAANGILFVYLVEKASIRVPVYDLLDWLQFYGERSKDGDWLGYLWTPHNEHRMVFSRILLALDVKWFGDQGETFAASGFVLLLGMAASICWKILKSDLSISPKLTAIPIAVLLLTPANTVITVGMQTMGGFLQTSSLGLFSLVLLDGAADQDPYSRYRRAAAIACACLAGFGDSGGLLIWPALMWSAWKGGLRWCWIVGIACVGTLFIAVYLWNLPSPPVSRFMDIDHLIRSFDYVIRFLGLPWSHMHELVWPARLIGLSIFFLGSLAFVCVSLRVCVSNLKRLGSGAHSIFIFDRKRGGIGSGRRGRRSRNADPLWDLRRVGPFGTTAVVLGFSGATLAWSTPTLISMADPRHLPHLGWPANCYRAVRRRGSQALQRCVVTLCCWRLDAGHASLCISGS